MKFYGQTSVAFKVKTKKLPYYPPKTGETGRSVGGRNLANRRRYRPQEER